MMTQVYAVVTVMKSIAKMDITSISKLAIVNVHHKTVPQVSSGTVTTANAIAFH